MARSPSEDSVEKVATLTALQADRIPHTHQGAIHARQRCGSVSDALVKAGLFENSQNPQWRISPDPFVLTREEVMFFESLGTHLLRFYKALNKLYLESLKGSQPRWAHEYFDQGKPQSLLDYGRMKRFREGLTNVIRPDVIPTEDGMVITELDSVPGGIGITGVLSQAYAALGSDIVGGPHGMLEGFSSILGARPEDSTGCMAIVLSDEAGDYRAEMEWVAASLQELGMEVYCVHPRDTKFTEESLSIVTPSGEKPVSLLYRFYELFDLKNIPKSELVMYSAKKGRVMVTPPYKPWLEEKLAFALLHHPMLRSFWEKSLGLDTFEVLHSLLPSTWILDPRPTPPHSIIPNLLLEGAAVSDWRQLAHATQRQRQFVIKPSGFSELAWGSRGVIIGHDVPQNEWAVALDRGLQAFETTPHVLQDFHKGRQYGMTYLEEQTEKVVSMTGRVRLSPYYFISDAKVRLGGILATLCPKDKKVIHGMRDAIMTSCAISI